MSDTPKANQSKEKKPHGSSVYPSAVGKLVQIFRSSWKIFLHAYGSIPARRYIFGKFSYN
jgi:methionine salvage enolase-phosphatase E1